MSLNADDIDARVRDAFSVWGKIDETDVKILEGLSLLGPRNFTKIADHLKMPITTVRYRVRRMLKDSILFFHLNPYHTNMGLKKVVIFAEAVQGSEDVLLDCLKVHDYWLFLCRIYGPYEGCYGIWTVPKGHEGDFLEYLQNLTDLGIMKSIELNWTTCHEGIPVQTRWFDTVENTWTLDWDEWLNEVETIEGELPWTLQEPDDWPIKVDREDLLIIKELEKDGRSTLTDISNELGISLEKVKYHFREHVMKRDLVEGYQVEIYRFPSLVSEYIFFKFEFHTYDQLVRFALSLHDKPFPYHLGKVIGERALVTQFYLPKWEFRKFIGYLALLKRKGLLKKYQYVLQDSYQSWRETIPYQHFNDGTWNYNKKHFQEKLQMTLEKWDISPNFK
jgi:DNA-binding Lrp family transcriptional regulator